jgi:Mg-chelatase subunit ChlD
MSFLNKIIKKDDKLVSQVPAVSSWKQKLETASGQKIKTGQPKRTLYLLLDCSTSMDDHGKIIAAKCGAVSFCRDAAAKGYAVGVIGFSHEAVCLREAVDGNGDVEEILRGLPASGSTDMTGALLMAFRKLKPRSGERTVCLVTDGMPDNKDSALKAATSLQASGIDIMAIGTDDADKAFLDRIVTNKDLSVKVARQQLQQGITSMARLLPG